MKKLVAITLSTLLLSSSIVAYADNSEAVLPTESTVVAEEVELNAYVFENVNVEEVLSSDDKNVQVLFKAENVIEGRLNEFRAYLSDKTVIIDGATQELIKPEDVKKGDKATVHYRENSPVGMSLPPVLNPEVVVINSDETPVISKVEFFNEEFVSGDNGLKLNLNQEVKFVDHLDRPMEKEDAVNKVLVVLYNISTKSIPAQTTPLKVFILESEEVAQIDYNKIIIGENEIQLDQKIYLEGETVMFPLRAVVEGLGFDIEWNAEERSANVSKDEVSHTVKTVTEIAEGFDFKSGVLKNSTTFVSESLLNEVFNINFEIVDNVFTIK
ncbi:MAG: hypothetical protein GXZ08_07835 [Tissierellia bacterium]|nr:hypothetical protein [Tissierellia bacterium]